MQNRKRSAAHPIAICLLESFHLQPRSLPVVPDTEVADGNTKPSSLRPHSQTLTIRSTKNETSISVLRERLLFLIRETAYFRSAAEPKIQPASQHLSALLETLLALLVSLSMTSPCTNQSPLSAGCNLVYTDMTKHMVTHVNRIKHGSN